MGKGRAAGRVELLVGKRGSGRVYVSPSRARSKKRAPMDNSEPLPNTETYERTIFAQKIALINHCTDVGKR